tara:strand:+ start:168 stop:1979 length:1812 start_codon:yes stop_codon:yes gene_type:complete
MQIDLLNDRDMEFLLYEVFEVQKLLTRPKYQEHSKEIFDASLGLAKKIALNHFSNHYGKGDANQPEFDGDKVCIIEETQQAWDAVSASGFFSAACSFDDDGMQLPDIIIRLMNAYFYAGNAATAGYCLLCVAAGNLIQEFGSDEQKTTFLPYMRTGRFTGTMALTEPNQGSSLQDMSTRAEPATDGSYRLFGQKMYISGGDHELTENIIHMVLAKTICPNKGKEGISLFICPKFFVDENGEAASKNDITLVGLLHKMGFRNATSTILNFGEKEGATGYLIGELNQGLSYMFQMMNEARIAVGMFAATLGYQGFNYSLQYARERKQGRLPTSDTKALAEPQVEIIRHADVRRMLLAQKVYAEGGLAMTCYASTLFEDSQTGDSAKIRDTAFMTLDLITPVVKSWPSKYCLKANDLAIQVLGGSGYTSDHPVEQYYRDNRLNPIHEGTEGIQAIDLLGRKVGGHKGKAFDFLMSLIVDDAKNTMKYKATAPLADKLLKAIADLRSVTAELLFVIAEDRERGLSNATIYLDYFGRVFAAWIWTKQALKAAEGLEKECGEGFNYDFYMGKLQAANYFMNWELPKMNQEKAILSGLYSEPLGMKDEWF